MNIRQVTVVALICTLMFGCGGGDDDGGSKGGGISLGGGDGGTGGETPGGGGIPGGGGSGGGGGTGGATPQDIAGVWVSPCLRSKSSGDVAMFAYGFDDEEGTPVYVKIKALYGKADSCSGDPENKITYVGVANYSGTTPASICTAHNYDSEYLSLTVNTNEYQRQALKTFLSNNGDNGSATGVACGVNGKLAISESDSNSSVRPRDVNQSFYFTKVESKYINIPSLEAKVLDALNTK